MNALYALVYVSRAVCPMQERELDELLVSARAHNRQHGISGFLAYERPEQDPDAPGSFVQRLEGDRDAVFDVFETRIQPSRLHTDIEIKLHGPISRRSFGDWSMAFDRRASDDPESFDSLIRRLEPTP